MKVERKNSLLTGRDLQQKRAQGGADIGHDQLGGQGKEQREMNMEDKQIMDRRRKKCKVCNGGI